MTCMQQFFDNLFLNYGSWLLTLLLLWGLVWKGLALWKAAHKEAKIWFVLLLIVNTVGLLEIAYIFLLHKIDFLKFFNRIKEKVRPKK